MNEKVAEIIKNKKMSFENFEFRPSKSPFSSVSMRCVYKGPDLLQETGSEKNICSHLTKSLNMNISKHANKAKGLLAIEGDLTEKSASNSNRHSPRSETTPSLQRTRNTPNTIKHKQIGQFKKLSVEKSSLFKRYQNQSLTRPHNYKDFSLEKSKSRSMVDSQANGLHPVGDSRRMIPLSGNSMDHKRYGSFVEKPFAYFHKASAKNLMPSIPITLNGSFLNGNRTLFERGNSVHELSRKLVYDAESIPGNNDGPQI